MASSNSTWASPDEVSVPDMTPIAARPHEPGLFLALAPMDGVTDWVYRDLMTRLRGGNSGISLVVSEFVRVTQAPVVPKVIVRHCPEVLTGGKTAAGVECFVQLLGGDAAPMAGSAARAIKLGAPGIDINFGCPAKTVNNHDGGATILKYPDRLRGITEAVRDAVPDTHPVSVKIRLGWDNADSLREIVQAIEAGGASWITIHGRTRTQLYRPPVDWCSIGRARDAVNIPVVANGDLNSVRDVAACRSQSGCESFMIGRGAMGRPLLFRQLRDTEEPELDLPWWLSLLDDYARALLAADAPPRAALGRLKQWLRLAVPAFEEIRPLFDRIKRMSDLDEARGVLEHYAPARGNSDDPTEVVPRAAAAASRPPGCHNPQPSPRCTPPPVSSPDPI